MAQYQDYQLCGAHLLDIRQVHRLEKAIFPKDAYSFIDLTLLFLSPGIRNVKMLAADGHLAAFLSVAAGHRRAWIITIGVSKEDQRRGLGRFLMEWIETQFAVKCIQLTVRASNLPAIGLYQSMGYRQVGRRAQYYVDKEDGLIMEKTIA